MLRQRPEWSKARNAICIIWGLDLILVSCSCLETFSHPRDILLHVSVPCCLPTIAWGIHQNHVGRISSGVVWVASEVKMMKIVHNASYTMWGLDVSLWSFALALAFIKTIWSQFALLLLLGAFAKTKEAALRLMCGCLRQRFAFCFVAEDFLSLFLHFFVSSLEIPFDKQVYNSYLHKIRNSTWQIALLLLIAQKHYFLYEALNIKEVSAQWARSEQQNPPFLHISHFCYGWGWKKPLRKVAYHF